jgi:hypothetical protein
MTNLRSCSAQPFSEVQHFHQRDKDESVTWYDKAHVSATLRKKGVVIYY